MSPECFFSLLKVGRVFGLSKMLFQTKFTEYLLVTLGMTQRLHNYGNLIHVSLGERDLIKPSCKMLIRNLIMFLLSNEISLNR